MDISTLVGIILGIIAVFVGMVVKGASLSVLINPAAFLIIIVGTIASITVAFPMKELKRIPKLFKILFTEQKLTSDVEIIKMFSSWADLARREGLLALESKAAEVEDPVAQERPADRAPHLLLVVRRLHQRQLLHLGLFPYRPGGEFGHRERPGL